MTTRDYQQLFKFPISSMSAVSAATGYLAYSRGLEWGLIPATTSTLILAFAASAINEAQEYKLDAQMNRTRLRPIPAGKITPLRAVIIAAVLAIIGFIALWVQGGAIAAGLGAMAMIWYNGIYTYVKRVSSLASVWGSVIGAIPPAMGWVAAGGSLDGPIFMLSFFFLMWQIPHFWLLALLVGKDYQKARFPTFGQRLGEASLARVTFIWTVITAGSALFLPLFGLTSAPFLGFVLFAAGIWIGVVTWRSLRAPSAVGFRHAFVAINYYALVVMGVVIADSVLWH
jgi:protoheme IX farnesyltransferase